MRTLALFCILLLSLVPALGQRNDWTVISDHSVTAKNLSLVGLRGDSLLATGNETSYAIPVATIRSLQHPEGSTPRSVRLLTGALIGGGTGFMIGTVIDAMNSNSTSDESFFGGDYKVVGVVGGAILGGMIGASSSSAALKKFDIGGMYLDEKEGVISAILSDEGTVPAGSPSESSGNVIHLKSGTDLTGTVAELIPDSVIKVITADSSVFVLSPREISSIDTDATRPATPCNIVYLKNGSVIRCALLKYMPDSTVTVRTGDGLRLQYMQNEISRIGYEVPSPSKVARNPASPSVVDRGMGSDYPHLPRPRFGLHAGVSLPTGDFSSTGASGGAAGTGYSFGCDLYVGEDVGWYTSATVAINPVDQSSLNIPSSVGTDFGSWSSIWLMSGMRAATPVSQNVEIYGFGQVGILFGGWPDIHVFYLGETLNESASSSTAVGFGFGAGMSYDDKYSLGFRFYEANPEYSVTATGAGMSMSAKGKQSTSMVLINFEILF
ncbi:MAG TPA: hypothetical protein VLY03_01205 [Bacteroidota bacterium]|nr:hypothetical protein [Bacteroidota bacterium]